MQVHAKRFLPGWVNYFAIAARSPICLLSIATILTLLPFSAKAFHIDDPLFVWAARQIEKTPFDFYRFDVNWYGAEMAASDVIKNPPLVSYYIAGVAHVIGWGERRLHLAFILPAVAAVIGMYFLARAYCSRPALAAVALLFTPVFLISSTNVMCDTMMLAFWIWALVLWDSGLRQNSWKLIMIAGVLASICALTKYFGICLLPLMFVYAVARKRQFGRWLTAFIFPIVMVGAYEWYTHSLYGHGLFGDAAGYAKNFTRTDIGTYTLVGLAFTGGCILSPIFYSLLIWDNRYKLFGMAALVILALVLVRFPPVHVLDVDVKPDYIWLIAIELAIFAVIGVVMLLGCVADLWRQRDLESLLLFLWAGGTFVFAAFLNWTINARSLLPMAPAIIMVFMRLLDSRVGRAKTVFEPRLAWPLFGAAVISFSVALADLALANSGRIAAYAVHEKIRGELGAIRFEGHWGFQYYMQALGGRPLNIINDELYGGDYLVMPSNTPNLFTVPSGISLKSVITIGSKKFIATMNRSVGAAFYASDWGPLPFFIGPVDPERYEVFVADHRLRFHLAPGVTPPQTKPSK